MELKEYSYQNLKELKLCNYGEFYGADLTLLDEEYLYKIIRIISSRKKNIFLVPFTVSVRENGEKYVLDGKYRLEAIFRLVNMNIISPRDVKVNVIEKRLPSMEFEIQSYLSHNSQSAYTKINESDKLLLSLYCRERTDKEEKILKIVKLLKNHKYLKDVEFHDMYKALMSLENNRLGNLTSKEVVSLISCCYQEVKSKWSDENKFIQYALVRFMDSKKMFYMVYYLIYATYDINKLYNENFSDLKFTIKSTNTDLSTLLDRSSKDAAIIIMNNKTIIEF